MRVVAHFVAKDLRRFGGWVVAFLLVALLPLAALVSDADSWWAWWATGLLDRVVPAVRLLLFVIVTVMVVHEDPPLGSTGFWLTRPIPASRLYAAKLLFVVIAMVGPAVIVESVMLDATGVGPSYLWPGAIEMTLEWGRWVAWTVLVASLARTMAGVVPVAVGVGGVYVATAVVTRMLSGAFAPTHFGIAFQSTSWIGSEWPTPLGVTASRAVVVWIVETFLLSLVTYAFYRRRSRRLAWALLAGAFLASNSLAVNWRWNLFADDGATTLAVDPQRLESVRLVVNPIARWDPAVVEVGDVLPGRKGSRLVDAFTESVPAPYVGEVTGLRGVVHVPGRRNGTVRTTDPLLNGGGWNVGAIQALLGGAMLVNLEEEYEPALRVMVEGASSPGVLEGSADVVLRRYDTTVLPLQAGAEHRDGAFHVVVHGVRCGKGDCSVSVSETDVDLLLAAPSRRRPRAQRMSFVRWNPDVVYLLRNLERGEAFWPQGGGMFGVGSFGRSRIDTTSMALVYRTNVRAGTRLPPLDAAWLQGADLVRIERQTVAQGQANVAVEDFVPAGGFDDELPYQTFAVDFGARAEPAPAHRSSPRSSDEPTTAGSMIDTAMPAKPAAFTLSDESLSTLCAGTHAPMVVRDVPGPGVEIRLTLGPGIVCPIDAGVVANMRGLRPRHFSAFALDVELVSITGCPRDDCPRTVGVGARVNGAYTPRFVGLDAGRRSTTAMTRLTTTLESLGVQFWGRTSDAQGRPTNEGWPTPSTVTLRVAPAADAVVDPKWPGDARIVTLSDAALLTLCGDTMGVTRRDLPGPGVELAFELPRRGLDAPALACQLDAATLAKIHEASRDADALDLDVELTSIGDADPTERPRGIALMAAGGGPGRPVVLRNHAGRARGTLSIDPSGRNVLESLWITPVTFDDGSKFRQSWASPGRVTLRLSPKAGATALPRESDEAPQPVLAHSTFSLSDEALMTLCSDLSVDLDRRNVPGPGIEVAIGFDGGTPELGVRCGVDRQMLDALGILTPSDYERFALRFELVSIDGKAPDGRRAVVVSTLLNGQGGFEPLGVERTAATVDAAVTGHPRDVAVWVRVVPVANDGRPRWKESVPADVTLRIAPPAGAVVLPKPEGLPRPIGNVDEPTLTLSDEMLLTLCSDAGTDVRRRDTPGPGIELTVPLYKDGVRCEPDVEAMKRLRQAAAGDLRRLALQFTLRSIDGPPSTRRRAVMAGLSTGRVSHAVRLGIERASDSATVPLPRPLERVSVFLKPLTVDEQGRLIPTDWSEPATVTLLVAPPRGAGMSPAQ